MQGWNDSSHELDGRIGDGEGYLGQYETDSGWMPVPGKTEYKVEQESNPHHEDEENQRNIENQKDNNHEVQAAVRVLLLDEERCLDVGFELRLVPAHRDVGWGEQEYLARHALNLPVEPLR
jgi:hypothetical protein